MVTHEQEAIIKAELLKATKSARAGRLDEAITLLKSILSLDPSHEISQGMLASMYLQLGMHDQAIALYEALLDKHSGNILARFQLGMARFNMGKTEAALDCWQPLLKIEDDFMARFHSALALIELQRNNEAYDLLKLAGEYMPGSHPLRQQLDDYCDKLSKEVFS